MGYNPTLSPNGKRLVFNVSVPSSIVTLETECCTATFNLTLRHLFLVDGSSVVQLTGLQEKNIEDTPIGWSNDGKTIFFDRVANIRPIILEEERRARILSDPREVWAIDADGANLRKIADGELDSISPDGKTLAIYRVVKEGDHYVGGTYLIDSDGSNPRLLRELAWFCYFSPHNDQLACFDLVSYNLILIDLEGKLVAELTQGIDIWPDVSWSPDGKWLSYVRTEEDGIRIWKLPIDGSSPSVRLTPTGFYNHYPNWVK